jgi:putative FmdB family regulatory protein
MLTYEYRCKKCKAKFVIQKEMSERNEPVACGCGSKADRVYTSPSIQFKGTGFYTTGG